MRSRVPALLAVVALSFVAGVSPAAAANDPLRAAQWGLDRIEAEKAWTKSMGAGALIAVLDTGVDLEHEDLKPRLERGHDGVDGDDEPQDEHGHGTALAGIAGAATGNDAGIAGVAPRSTVLPVRVLDRAGAGSETAITTGIAYAVTRAAQLQRKLVILLALADGAGVRLGPTQGRAIAEAVDYASTQGALVVLAAGASASWSESVRSSALWVGSVDESGAARPAAVRPDVLAPGDGVVTTAFDPKLPDRHDAYACADASCASGRLSGTSYAAATVAGVGALLLSTGVRSDVARQRITKSADTVPSAPAGRVNAARALAVEDAQPPTASPSLARTPAPPATPAVATSVAATPRASDAAVVAAPRAVVPTPTPPLPPVPVLPGTPADTPSDPHEGSRLVRAAGLWFGALTVLLAALWLVRDRSPAPVSSIATAHRPVLDGLRGTAALWVVSLHTVNANLPPGRGVPWWLWPFTAGALGVDLFFVLSGFLLVQRWEASRGSGRAASARLGSFLKRRIVRIAPAFLVAMAVLVPLRAPDILRSARDTVLLATGQQYFVPTLPWKVDGPIWSITTELHFYLLLPLVALAFRKLGSARVVAVFFGLSLAWRIWSQDVDLWPANFLLGRIDQFSVGMLAGLAVASRAPGRVVRVLSSRGAGVVIGVAFAVFVVLYGRFYGLSPSGLNRAAETYGHPLAGLFLAAILVRVTAGKPIRILESPPLVFVGLVSFGLYLWHAPFLAVVPPGPGRVPKLFLAVGAALVVGCVSYALIERPASGMAGRQPPHRSGGRMRTEVVAGTATRTGP